MKAPETPTDNTIRSLRLRTGLTQTEFGRRLGGIPLRSIQSWEYGERTGPPYVMELIRFRVEHSDRPEQERPMKAPETPTDNTIHSLRLRTGLTQTEFGRRLGGIPLRTVQNWERGVSACPPYVMELIRFRVEHDDSIPKIQ